MVARQQNKTPDPVGHHRATLFQTPILNRQAASSGHLSVNWAGCVRSGRSWLRRKQLKLPLRLLKLLLLPPLPRPPCPLAPHKRQPHPPKCLAVCLPLASPQVNHPPQTLPRLALQRLTLRVPVPQNSQTSTISTWMTPASNTRSSLPAAI